MKTQITLKEAAGRTLTGAEITGGYSDDGLLLSFEDGTFAFLKAVREGEDLEIEEATLNLLWISREALVRLGVATQEEIDDLRRRAADRREASRRERAEAQDVRDYARLKAKFEKGSA